MTRIDFNDRMGRIAAAAATVLWGVMATACVYNPDEKCGEDLVELGEGLRCQCPKGSVYSATGCIKCGKNEVAGLASCDCKAGFSRATAGAACTKTKAPVESTDTSEGTDTADEAQSCSGPDDCTAPAMCKVSTGMCVEPPTGLKTPCTTQEECAGFEAGYCNVGFSGVCEVNKCDVVNNDCFPGFHCCDVTALMIAEPLCIEEMYTCP